MITTDQINAIHSKYNELAENDADLCSSRNMNDLMMFAIDSDFMDFDGDQLTFAKGSGPLSAIEIERISGAEDMGSHMAIITPTGVIFVDKQTGELNIYLAD